MKKYITTLLISMIFTAIIAYNIKGAARMKGLPLEDLKSSVISINKDWRFRLDLNDAGIKKGWHKSDCHRRYKKWHGRG